MSYRIILDESEIRLNNNGLYFRGYINHKGKLLYDSQAETEIGEILNSVSPPALFNTINGAFQFVCLRENKLYFSIDHFGGYSLFYKIKSGNLELFDNPMLLPDKHKLNDRQVCQILATGFTLGQDTAFAGILECLPGTLYYFDLITGKLESKKWFNYFSVNERSLDFTKLSVILQSLFPDTDGGEYTLSLSGGVDSRLLLGCLLNREKPFKTYSFGSELNQDKHIAVKLAAQFNLPHQLHNFTPEICSRYFNEQDFHNIFLYCTQARSIPNETDVISAQLLAPQSDIIVKGFGGDWLSGRYITDKLRSLETPEQMTRYLFDKYFHLTAISSNSFRNLLWKDFETLMHDHYYNSHPGLISAEEQWNQHHNERKYIINTLSCYKARGFKIYLPFYDRRLMNFFAKLKFSEKTDQYAYFKYLRKCYFTGRLAPLREIPTLRHNFALPIELNFSQRIREGAHTAIRKLDLKKIRKRFFLPALQEYSDSLMLFTHELKTRPYLRNTIKTNFPAAQEVAAAVKATGCPEGGKHLDWLSRQVTAQININGLSFCKFFLNPEFLRYLNDHVS